MTEHIKKWMAKLLISFCSLLPIKKNKIFIYSYYGSSFGCNPKYIANYIAEHVPDTFDIVWAFHEPASKPDLPQMRKVKTMTFAYFYEFCTAKVIITNYRTTDLFMKRKQQYYIQTWHSSLRLKQIEKDAEDVLPSKYVKMAREDASKCDLLLSGCQYSTTIFKRAFWYSGEIFEHGTPRNDVLVQHDFQKKSDLRQKLRIPKGKKIVLYAPTFRTGNHTDVYPLDYIQLTRALEKKDGNEWMVLVKLHPHLLAASRNPAGKDEDVIDVTSYDDIQELLLLADAVITDYSSLMFDFAITKRPCFLYVPDLEAYTSGERKLYFEMEQLPFRYATSNKELMEKIAHFQEEVYQQEVTVFLRKMGSFENGRASERLAERLEEVCGIEKRSDMDEAV